MARLTKLQRKRWAALREQLTDTIERLDVANGNAARWYNDRDHARDERNDALEEMRQAREAAAAARTAVEALNNVVARMFTPEAVRALLGRCVSPDLVPVFSPCETARDFDIVLKSLDVFKSAVESHEAADVVALIEAGNKSSAPMTTDVGPAVCKVCAGIHGDVRTEVDALANCIRCGTPTRGRNFSSADVEAPRCATGCGTRHDTHEHHGEMGLQDVVTPVSRTRCYCTEACLAAGKALRPGEPRLREHKIVLLRMPEENVMREGVWLTNVAIDAVAEICRLTPHEARALVNPLRGPDEPKPVVLLGSYTLDEYRRAADLLSAADCRFERQTA